jgi:hypothetical protein
MKVDFEPSDGLTPYFGIVLAPDAAAAQHFHPFVAQCANSRCGADGECNEERNARLAGNWPQGP